MDRQFPGGGVARLGQCARAGDGDAGRRHGADSLLAAVDFRPRPGAAARIAGAGIAFALYYVAAMLVLLRYMTTGRSGLTLKLAPLQGAAVRGHSEGRPADGDLYHADQSDRDPGDRRGRAVRHQCAGRLRHRLAARLHHDPDPVRALHRGADHGRRQHGRRSGRPRQKNRMDLQLCRRRRRRHDRRDRGDLPDAVAASVQP